MSRLGLLCWASWYWTVPITAEHLFHQFFAHV